MAVFVYLTPQDINYYIRFTYLKIHVRDIKLNVYGVYRVAENVQEQIAHSDLCRRLMNDQASVMYSNILDDVFKNSPFIAKEYITYLDSYVFGWTDDDERRSLASIPLRYFGRRCCGVLECSEHRQQLRTRKVQRNYYTKCLQFYLTESKIGCDLINLTHRNAIHVCFEKSIKFVL